MAREQSRLVRLSSSYVAIAGETGKTETGGDTAFGAVERVRDVGSVLSAILSTTS